ncbi:MAG: hypothetical protein COU63_00385 [Candidatus Pacebacteria bacterium CG10_big_fil_rev_8_21_14_0_10_36_11]|nr:aminotransferase class I/II-fold pyridoxal phosphate-dependent enzyme [Candidatus Pacearchaeota archaeon]OIP74212.1 MAG: hypothetical protein AUK08_03135 [Candidatus Pacebacteria bacterium CG2_30_36_39]PIR65115.1 MAG: hypothetical protein COU63_00385 [Candidatus Pacebacteria bacterium CG10_big_fil_rev_8_21_14_0_10_36_11]PJC42670.1 MAG: hypothetical protein CO040_03275 [Candidatus Pacebacteria bacterium CG_4_9_14_0_2_um_filter_36_8]
MLNNISQRASEFPDNPIRGLEPLANQARAAGINIIPLNIGAPDTFSPKQSIESAVQFLQNTPALKYGPSAGNLDLIAQLTRFYTKKCGFTGISPENLMVTQGASEALDLVFYAVADQEDTIATPDPTYPNYLTIANKNSLKMYALPTSIQAGFHLSKESLENLPEDLKAIIWSSPNNPTGAVYQEEELQMLLEISRQRKIWLIADEVYRSLVFEQDKPGFYRAPSILDYATKEDLERIIVLDSMSKLLGLCGARIGSITAPSELIKTMVKIASTRGCPSTISQAAITSINEIPDSFFVDNRAVFQQRRDLLYTKLAELADLGVVVPPQPPEGAFYLVVELTGINGADFAKWLLTEYPALAKTKETLFITPMLTNSGGFYLDRSRGKSQIRLAYVISEELLVKAVEILKKAISLYLSTRK